MAPLSLFPNTGLAVRPVLLGLLLAAVSACDPAWSITVAGQMPSAISPECARSALLHIQGVDSVIVGPVAQAAGDGSYFIPVTRHGLGRVTQRRQTDSTFRLSALYGLMGPPPRDSVAKAKEGELRLVIDTLGHYCAPSLADVEAVRDWN